MKFFYVFILMLILSGCASGNKFVVAEYEVNEFEKLPPISLFSKQPSEELRKKCNGFDGQSVLHHCTINQFNFADILSELQDSGVFSTVHFGDGNTDYELMVSVANYNHEGGAELGQAVLAGATLLLAPVVTTIDVQVEAVLAWNNRPLKKIDFEIPFQARVSLFTMNKDPNKDLAKSVVSHIIHDFQSSDAFSPQYLSRSLGASDYENDLKIPDFVGEYRFDDKQIYRHPFWGTQIRFQHEQFYFDYVDVFVYPIRDWSWNDEVERLTRESVNVRKDIELAEKQGVYKDILIGEDAITEVNVNGTIKKVLSFSGEAFHNEGQKVYITRTHLLIKEDKFIKVRTSYEKTTGQQPNFDGVIESLVEKLVVPEESLFMAQLRKQWRDTGQL